MTNLTPNLRLNLLASGQSQKHLFLNDAITILDKLSQLVIKSRSVTTPPASPNSINIYAIPANATGDWANYSGYLTYYDNGAWNFVYPKDGWLAFDVETNEIIYFKNNNWVSLTNVFQNLAPSYYYANFGELSAVNHAVLNTLVANGLSYDNNGTNGSTRIIINQAGTYNINLQSLRHYTNNAWLDMRIMINGSDAGCRGIAQRQFENCLINDAIFDLNQGDYISLYIAGGQTHLDINYNRLSVLKM